MVDVCDDYGHSAGHGSRCHIFADAPPVTIATSLQDLRTRSSNVSFIVMPSAKTLEEAMSCRHVRTRIERRLGCAQTATWRGAETEENQSTLDGF
jgi:malate synthase